MARIHRHPVQADTVGTEAELIACVLYWGLDRRVPVDRVGGLLAGLPDWLQREHRLRGSNDAMVQCLILDHLRARAGG